MPTDIKLNQLIINQLTQEQYDEAKAAGTLSDTELYITDSDDDPQVKSNLSQIIDDSTTKYPSNKAVKDESSRITTLMDNKVSKSGNETISGLKTFNDKIYFASSGANISLLGGDSTIELGEIIFEGNNIYPKTINLDRYGNCLRVFGQHDQTVPHAILTNESINKSANSYIRFGNGLQICWFYPQISGSAGSNKTLTLPVAFSNTDYLALVQQTGDSPTNDYTNTLSIMSKTTTNFVIRKAMSESMYLQVLCVGYWY